jgi:hypothetical protein
MNESGMIKNSDGKIYGDCPLSTSRTKWENNNMMDFRETGCEM